MKILIIKTGAFGDIILSSISFQTIKENFKEGKIYLLTKKIYKEVVEDCPIFEEVFILSENKNFFNFLKLIKRLRKLKFDIIFDLQGNLKTNFLSFLLNGEKRIGLYGKSFGKFFLTKSIKKNKCLNPISHQKYFFKEIGIEKISDLKIWISEKKEIEFDNFLKEKGLLKKSYIVIHPVASSEWKTKRWLPIRFAEVSDILINKGYKIVFIGQDKKGIKEIIKLMKNKPFDLSGETSFFQLSLLIKNSFCLLTTDSAPLHIGAVFKVKTLAIFGPTEPERHCPSGINYIYKKVSCSPCYKKICRDLNCMINITTNEVLEKLDKL